MTDNVVIVQTPITNVTVSDPQGLVRGGAQAQMLTKYGSADFAAHWVTGLHVNVQDYFPAYGGDAAGTTDCSAAIAAAIAALPTGALGVGGTVSFPYGKYLVKSQVLVPNKVVLRGSGRSSSILFADPTFPVSTPIVRLGDTTQVFGTRIEEMTVDANGVTGSINVYSARINEHSGVYGCALLNAVAKGIHVENLSSQVPQNFAIRDTEVYLAATAGASAVGIHLNAQGAPPRGLQNVTVSVTGGTTLPSGSVAIDLDGCVGGVYAGIHVEHFDIGVRLGNTVQSGGLGLIGVSGHSSIGQVIRLVNVAGVHVGGVQLNGATSTLTDVANGFTSTASLLGFYDVGNGSGVQVPVYTDDRNLTTRFGGSVTINGGALSLGRLFLGVRTTQAIIANGALTIDSSSTNSVEVDLSANVTSTTITNPVRAGQILVITFVQDVTGGRTYVWPTNAVFTGGTAPSGTASLQRVTVTLEWDGTNWNEVARGAADKLLSANNLSDLANATTARTNLGAKAPDIQVFDYPTLGAGLFTWNKPAGAKMVQIIAISAGGGGGSGRKGLATTIRQGGGGGGGGGWTERWLPASILSASENVNIGTIGLGGTAQATNSTDGNPGTSGGSNCFFGPNSGSNYGCISGRGGGGGGGLSGAGTGGSAGIGQFAGSAGGTPGAGGGGVNAGNSAYGAAGGGSGGGITAADAAQGGGNGGTVNVASTGLTGGVGGVVAGAAPTSTGNSTVATALGTAWGAQVGAGGGAGSKTGNAQDGANGVYPGGGGGGGGGSLDATGNSGKGGDGGGGVVVVISYF